MVSSCSCHRTTESRTQAHNGTGTGTSTSYDSFDSQQRESIWDCFGETNEKYGTTSNTPNTMGCCQPPGFRQQRPVRVRVRVVGTQRYEYSYSRCAPRVRVGRSRRRVFAWFLVAVATILCGSFGIRSIVEPIACAHAFRPPSIGIGIGIGPISSGHNSNSNNNKHWEQVNHLHRQNNAILHESNNRRPLTSWLGASSSELGASSKTEQDTHTATVESESAFGSGSGSLSPGDHNDYPNHYVWIWNDSNDDGCGGGELGSGTWRRPSEGGGKRRSIESKALAVAKITRNWCERFVVELDLCPWAKASAQTPGAMRFFVVPPMPMPLPPTQGRKPKPKLWEEAERKTRIVHDVAERFQAEILSDGEVGKDDDEEVAGSLSPSTLERAAIYFVVFLSAGDDDGDGNNNNNTGQSQSSYSSFFEYIDWFTELEDDWPEELDEDVIVAPFHPAWEFGTDDYEDGEDDDATTITACLDYEKRSPYPLVTLVSTRVVEKAGEAVTNAIGEHNEDILLSIEEQSQQQQQGCGDHDDNGDGTATNRRDGRNLSVAELWRRALYGTKH